MANYFTEKLDKEFIDDFNGFPTDDDQISNDTPMRKYFRGKTILLTGGTGFLGQLYTEKALRSEVKCIYILTRPKKGVRPEDRIKDIFSGKHFSKLYAQDNNYLERIRIIEGDMSQCKLGISKSDTKDIEENVEIIIHAAAEVRFDETLRNLLITNLRGTHELLKIAENTKKLEVFAHISTAYSHCYRHDIDEKFYEPPIDPYVMLKFADKYHDYPDETLEIIQDRIIRPWPNTYTYSKALSEELVRRFGEKFPICIIRPTIVISTHEDPIPGWCNNKYGLNGCLVACGTGILRLMPLKKDIIGDVICADFVINSTLAAIWVTQEDYKKNKTVKKNPEIYHVCSYADRPVPWRDICDETHKLSIDFPTTRALWKPTPNCTTCPVMWRILSIYYHVIPGIFFDFLLKLKGKKVKLLPAYRRVQKLMDALKYFMSTEIKFTNSNMKRVLAKMSREDQDFFPSDVRRYNWFDFCYNYVKGLNAYIMCENPDNLPEARKHYKKLVKFHVLVLMVYYGIHLFLLYKILNFYNFFDNCRKSVIDTYEFLQNPE